MTVDAPVTGLRQRNKQRRIEQILEATRALLREQPGESPSVERIAARAEVAPATVFNLVGPREEIWAALADELIAELERRTAAPGDLDPHARARQVAAIMVDIICGDADVYRYVLAHWSQSGRVLRRDPTAQLTACLRAAAEAGTIRDDLELVRLGEMIAVACGGAAQQWAAGLIGDRALRARCRNAVDIVFAAATPSHNPAAPEYLTALLA